MPRRIAVRGIILLNDQLLCARLYAYHRGGRTPNNWWRLPGGGLEENEALRDGVHREMIEETGVAPVVGNLLFVQQFSDQLSEYLEFFFHIVNAADYVQTDLATTTHGLKEIAELQFCNPSSIRLLPEFLTTEPLSELIAANQAPIIISRL